MSGSTPSQPVSRKEPDTHHPDSNASPARRFDRTPTSSRHLRTPNSTGKTALTPISISRYNQEFTFRSPPAAAITFPSIAELTQSQKTQSPYRLESVGTALLASLSRRATITEQRRTSLRIGSATGARTGAGSIMLDRVSNSAEATATKAPSSAAPPSVAPMYTQSAKDNNANTATASTNDDSSKQKSSTDHASIDSGQTALTPMSRCTFEIPNDNENDGQYGTEFWLNALVPKPHTNFFGYEATIGPICISISTRESHECYKALVRTPFKFGVVYVPTMVIDEPVFGTDLDRLLSPTPQKVLLYHALRLYFQQAEDERRGYLLTALRNKRLSADSAVQVVNTVSNPSADAMLSRYVSGAAKDASTTKDALDRKPTRKRGLQRSNTKRSIELRRAEINEFMDGLFQSSTADQRLLDDRLSQARPNSASGGYGSAAALEETAMLSEIDAFLSAERDARDLAVATESLTEIRDDHLKPLLRSLEPRIYRRRLRIDFVVVGASAHHRLTDMAAPHRRFLRTLERASARMRGESSGVSDLLHHSANSTPERNVTGSASSRLGAIGSHVKAGKQQKKRQKTQEEMRVKRNNVIQELIETERSYVEKLRALIDIYAVPLRSAARSANNALIPAYDAHVIFGNIERVSEVNERFLGDLEAWNRGEMDPKETIGSLCRDHFVDFHVYKRYINGYQHALASSRELEAKNPLYAAFLQRAREREECKKLGISDLLIMPVQRIPRYTLLLTDLMKVIPDDDPDVPRIRLALERVNEIGQLADNQVAETVAQLHHIHTTVEGCPPNIISASREFIGAIDASEIDLVTGAAKKPMCLLVFSDLVMLVERFWPPKGHGEIRVTGNSSSRQSCPIHTASADSVKPAIGPPSALGGAGNATTASTASPAMSASGSTPGSAPLPSNQQHAQHICTCSSSYASSSPVANAFLSTTSGSANNRKKWGRFAGWIDVARVGILEKSASPNSRLFFIHRYPDNIDDTNLPAVDSGFVQRQRTGTSATPGSNPVGLRSSGSSIISLDSNNNGSPVPSLPIETQQRSRSVSALQATEKLHQSFARILYPSETTYESYGDHGYWYPQSLHEFEADHPLSKDAFFEFLNTAWERDIARCFEASASGLTRQSSSSGSAGHRKTKSGAEVPSSNAIFGHPELDRVDVGGQSWTVRIWDSVDYGRSRTNCPSALLADMTIVWDYRQLGSPNSTPALYKKKSQVAEGTGVNETSGMSYYPFQACRVVDFGDDYFHVTSTVLPLDTHQSADAALDTYAELVEEREVADNWPALCRLVEQAVVMYQYVLLAYPEHRRIQQCYNRSILASLFGQNALGSSSAVKAETVSAAPRKLFSRAKHLFSSGRLRTSTSQRESVDTANLFSSAYNNAVGAETIGPSSGSSPYNHSTISAPLTVLGKYKLKTKSSTVVSSRRVNTIQQDRNDQSPAKSASPLLSTPTRSTTAHGSLYGQTSLGGLSVAGGGLGELGTGSNNPGTADSDILGVANIAAQGKDGARFQPSRKISHTLDEFPSFPSILADDSIDIKSRSETSRDHRNKGSSNATSSLRAPSPTKQKAFTFATLAAGDKATDRVDMASGDTLPLQLAAGSGGKGSISKASTMSSGHDTFTKRRSMSVVSVGSIGKTKVGAALFGSGLGLTGSKHSRSSGERLFGNPSLSNSRPSSSMATATATAKAGVRRRRDDDEDDGGCEGDSTSEFSIQLDLKHHGEKLDIPRDLKLEFDEALSAADATPPGSSSHGLSLDMQSFASHLSDSVCTTHVDSSNANIGLNVLIPAQDTKGQNAKSTWDSTSPDYDTAKQQHLLLRSSADSLASSTSSPSLMSSVKGASSRSLNRRQGVYRAPPKSPVAEATSPSLQSASEKAPQPTLRSRPDILLDIARELGEGEPFGSPTQTSLLHVDDGDMSHHLSQLSLLGRSQISPIFPSFDHVFSGIRESERSPEHSNIRQEPGRTLPPLPPHTRSLNYGGGGDKQAVSTTEAAPTASTLQNASRSRTFASNSHGANRAHAGGRSRIPHPPSSRYNLQQQQGVAAQSTTTYSNSDYRRLPSLPPRVRSTAATSYMDKHSTYNTPKSPT
ncbi:hypothetical protein EV177_002540 [Coemansia sp. RSA 1804]|nr:hypothetical protein EV177_002540 [Coemansia sp. RSA 1804]